MSAASVQLTGFRLSPETPADGESTSPESSEVYENCAHDSIHLVGSHARPAPNQTDSPADTQGDASRHVVEIAEPIRREKSSKLDLTEEWFDADSQPEPFKIIWRDLAFEVKLNTFKQTARDVVRSLTTCRSSKRSDATDYSDECKPDSGLKSRPKDAAKPRKRVIFEGLNGYAKSGEITAILGPSGAGKSSLINAICGFETQNHSGSIQLVGGSGDKKRMQLSLIPQKDYLINELTVRENLSFSSRILNSNKGFDHKANIERVVKVFNLKDCIDTQCKHLSGGEYKRVSIAQELLRQPDILVLDEPTSGLDSLNCKKLINTLKDLIDASLQGTISPIAIIMTIHQPDVDIYSMFDHVYCMALGGRVIFDGHPKETLEVLRDRGGLQVPTDISVMMNPANLLIEIASNANNDENSVERLAAYQRDKIEKDPLFHQTRQDHTEDCDQHAKEEPAKAVDEGKAGNQDANQQQLVRDKRLALKNQHRGLFWYHTSLLTRRAFLGTVRDPIVSVVSLIFHLAIPFTMWFVYPAAIGKAASCPKLVRDISMYAVADQITDRQIVEQREELVVAYECATMFFLTTYSFALCSAAVAALAFPLNMHVLLKELRNGWYGLSCSVLAKTISNMPIEVLFPSFSFMLTYYLLEMPSSYMQWRMLATAAVMALVTMIASTQGLIFGAIFMNNTEAAVFMSGAGILPQTLLSGFTGRISNMPPILQYASLLNPLKYACDLNSMVRYGFAMCKCEPETDAYLRSTEARFSDLPAQMVSIFNYYMQNVGTFDNETLISDDSTAANATLSQPATVPGINYDFRPNPGLHSRISARIESGQLDLFAEIADLFSTTFSYARRIESCEDVRSQFLTLQGIPSDERILSLFGSMIGLLVLWKIILYICVRVKIEART